MPESTTTVASSTTTTTAPVGTVGACYDAGRAHGESVLEPRAMTGAEQSDSDGERSLSSVTASDCVSAYGQGEALAAATQAKGGSDGLTQVALVVGALGLFTVGAHVVGRLVK